MTESLYRKYRPQTFADVVGQDAIERTLRNALAQQKVSHAYLFTGPRGTGKTTTARLMAKAILCDKGVTPDPDGTCESCRMIADGVHPDVYELDAASRTGVENVREEIISRVNFAPTVGRAKIYIIDEVHMLSTAAFNALLKTLEEPPDHVVFILCTTDPQKVPATIHSRCQRFDFHRISSDQIVSRLGAVCVSEGVEFEPEALALIADRSDGGMRNALTTLEQLIVFCDGKVSLSGAEDLLGSAASSDMAEIVRAIGRRDAKACFSWTAQYVETGADLAQFVADLAMRVRTLYVMSVAGEDVALELTDADRAELQEELRYFGPDRLGRLLMIVGDLLTELRGSRNPRLAFEIALVRMVHPDSDLTLESLAERVEALENRPAGTVPIAEDAAMPAPAPLPAEHPLPSPSAAAARQPEPGAVPVAPPVAAAPEPSAPTRPVAPAPQPAPAAAAPAAAGGVRALSNPAALQRAWKASIDQLKSVKTAYGVLFMNTTVVPDDAGDALVVVFPATNAFAYSAASRPEVYDELQRAVAQAFGAPLTVRFVKEGGPDAPAMPGRPADSAPVSAAAPAPVPQPAPVSAPRPPASAAPQPAPVRPAPAAPPRQAPAAYDEVPVDLYDEVPVDEYDDGYYAPDVPAPRPAARPAPDIADPFIPPTAPAAVQARAAHAQASAPRPTPQPETPGASPTSRPPVPGSASRQDPAAASAPEDSGDIADALASAFGDSVTFEEVEGE